MAPRPNPKVAKAIHAMKALGVSEDVVKPVLKNLLQLYEKKWDLIEDENYRALADAIFEREDEKVAEQKRKLTDNDVSEDPVQPLKRLQTTNHGRVLDSTEDNTASATGTSHPVENMNAGPVPMCLTQRGKHPILPEAFAIAEASEVHQPWNTNGALHLSRKSPTNAGKELISSHKPKREEISVCQRSELPIILKEPKVEPGIIPEKETNISLLIKPKDEPVEIETSDFEVALTVVPPDPANEKADTRHENIVGESLSISEIASFLFQEVETTLSHNHIGGQGNLDAEHSQDNSFVIHEPAHSGIDSGADHPKDVGYPSDTEIGKESGDAVAEKLGSNNAYKQNDTAPLETNYFLHAADITRGEEKVKISVVNHYNGALPQPFHYIHDNLVGENACVNFSLAQIGNPNYCSSCVGSCLSSNAPCKCAHKTGGGNVYTPDGISNEEFLKDCISITRSPQKHQQFFCETCPLEVGKDVDELEPCKGHIVRKFIKECWWKCRCSRHCNNRLVQCGITRNLQVFMTSGRKGWGLRTLEDLPKGAFVCEYVGEILTVPELYSRNPPNFKNQAGIVILDAGWGSLTDLTEEKALCLDATFYGNVARYINHRCVDANLVVIPVEVEISDHHYYRVALFTSRKVDALEELTRDYGIDFDDCDRFSKPFQCHCGSTFCRDMKHYNRNRVKEKLF